MARNGGELCDDIRSSIDMIASSHVAGYDESAFKADPRAQDAVIYRLMVIGEAAGDLVDRHGLQIQAIDKLGKIEPFLSDFRRMRDLLIHQHWKVSLRIVWDTIGQDLQPLDHMTRWLKLQL
jgi:uncharacterized protein with HEPN domain